MKCILRDESLPTGIDQHISNLYEETGFTRGLGKAYRAMADNMSDNGIQVIMFAHKKLAPWVSLLKAIVYAGLRVTKTWQITTETSNKGMKSSTNIVDTVCLVLRKRDYMHKQISKDALIDSLKLKNKSIEKTGHILNDMQYIYANIVEVFSQYTQIDDFLIDGLNFDVEKYLNLNEFVKILKNDCEKYQKEYCERF